MNLNEKYLPLGTVVRLNGGKKNIMIIGFSPVSSVDNMMYDYSACLYPEGMVSSEINILFNHSQIDEILFKGFVNEEEVLFKQKFNEFMQQGTIDGKVPTVDLLNKITTDQFVQERNIDHEKPQMF